MPGPTRGRFLNLTVEVLADGVKLSGCVEGVRNACEETALVTLGSAGRATLKSRWCEAIDRPRCNLTELRDGRSFVIQWAGGELVGSLPGDGTPPEKLYGNPCSAPHRLMLWLIETFARRTAAAATR
jgi:hypothetical protein